MKMDEAVEKKASLRFAAKGLPGAGALGSGSASSDVNVDKPNLGIDIHIVFAMSDLRTSKRLERERASNINIAASFTY